MTKRNLLIATFLGLSLNISLAETYTIGVEQLDYYPHYASKGGSDYTGFARDLLDAFAKKTGHTFTYKPLPVKRLYDAFVAEQVDFKYPDSQYWSQDIKKGKNIVYSTAVINYIDGVVIDPKNKGKGIDAIKTLGLIGGFEPWALKDHLKSGKIKEDPSNSFKAMLEKTLSGKNDAAYGNIDVINHILTQELKKPGALIFDESVPHSKDSYYLSTIKAPKVIEQFNQFLKDEKATIDQLKAKYQLK